MPVTAGVADVFAGELAPLDSISSPSCGPFVMGLMLSHWIKALAAPQGVEADESVTVAPGRYLDFEIVAHALLAGDRAG